ncbi:MAG: iron-containing alcohol dehydrogenase [Chromatiales bacterium]|jgi:hydroxyacid-oxoacid transhydrogenase|nr:iron-containing alcohol dehydrogenase [Chromatiales bacterium]
MSCCQHFAPVDGGAQTFTVAMPRVTFGRGALAEAGERAKALGMTRVALFTDPHLTAGPYVDTVRSSLEAAGLVVGVFDDIRVEPTDSSVMDGTRFLNDGEFDGMVSVGGGSVIDTAKGALVYHRYPATFSDYFAPPVGTATPVPGPVLPHLACPTTCGTGSECTGLSVIRIGELDTKFVIASRFILPDAALVDPTCAHSLPGKVLASTAFDLLSHALECYTARAYTQWPEVAQPMARPMIQGANPWSDLSAREALKLVGKYLVRGVEDADDSEARDSLMWAATLAGMAFGNAGTHLPHGLSYGVTHLMREITTEAYPNPSPFVPHGISVIVNSPSVFRYTAPGAPERHLQAADYLGFDVSDAGLDDAGEVVATRIIAMMRETDMPNGLGGVGFQLSDVKALATSAVRQGRAVANSPRETNLNDIETIYERAMSYW